MRHWFLVLAISSLFLGSPIIAFSDVSGLTLCENSTVFKRRCDDSIKKLTQRLQNYDENTPFYLAIKSQIERTETRFVKYRKQKMLCGSDGLPHLVVDGRWSHAGEFLLPGLLFLYITGWIGWAGRSYLQFAKESNNPIENEYIINVPVAVASMLKSVFWPLLAYKELRSNKLLVPGDEVCVGPR